MYLHIGYAVMKIPYKEQEVYGIEFGKEDGLGQIEFASLKSRQEGSRCASREWILYKGNIVLLH